MTRLGEIAAAVAILSLTASLGAQSADQSGQSRQPSTQVSAQSRGYRLRGYQWDPILGQRWAVLEGAGHPDWPLLAQLAPEFAPAPTLSSQVALSAAPAAAPAGVPARALAPPPLKLAAPTIHSGDSVTAWSDERNVRMQLSAVAEGNAGIGERIQLRVTGAGVNGNTGWRVTGIVRGPGSVEIE
jgi:hypothetical protein